MPGDQCLPSSFPSLEAVESIEDTPQSASFQTRQMLCSQLLLIKILSSSPSLLQSSGYIQCLCMFFSIRAVRYPYKYMWIPGTEYWSWNHICHLYGAWDLWILSLFMFKCSIKWSSGSRLSKNSIFCLHLRDSSLLSSFLLPWKWKKPLSFWKFSVFWNRMLYVYNFHLFDKTILLIPQYPQYGPSDTKLLTNTDTSS